MQDFISLQERVKTALNQDLQQSNISIVQLMSAMYILSNAKNEEELLFLMDTLQNDYKALGAVLTEVKESEKSVKDADIQILLSNLIKDNPAQASDIAEMASNKATTLADVLAKFPEAKKYLD